MNDFIDFSKYSISSVCFLSRARSNLTQFDSSNNPQFLFYAALELRSGIECRLYEYIHASLKGKAGSKGITEYVASKLFRKLLEINPSSEHEAGLCFGPEKDISWFVYRPITKIIIRMHGELGEMLHYKFFNNNPHWYYNVRSKKRTKSTIMDYRCFLDAVYAELENICSGDLLSIPNFDKLVNTIAIERQK